MAWTPYKLVLFPWKQEKYQTYHNDQMTEMTIQTEIQIPTQTQHSCTTEPVHVIGAGLAGCEMCIRDSLYLFLYSYYNIACDKIIVKRYPVIVTHFCISWWGARFSDGEKSWEKWKNPLTRCGDFGIITRTKKQNNALFSPPHQVRMVDTVDGCSMYLAVPIGCAKRRCV